LSVKSQLRLTYLCSFSKPPEDRLLYKAIHDARPAGIVEIGIGSGQRAMRMLEVAAFFRPAAALRYTGIDLFEARTAEDGPGLTLIVPATPLPPWQDRPTACRGTTWS
jgi:hypothetical protein